MCIVYAHISVQMAYSIYTSILDMTSNPYYFIDDPHYFINVYTLNFLLAGNALTKHKPFLLWYIN